MTISPSSTSVGSGGGSASKVARPSGAGVRQR